MIRVALFDRRAARVAMLPVAAALLVACSPNTGAPTGSRVTGYLATCSRDAEIDANRRDAIAKTADGFMAALFGDDPSQALAFVSKDWKDEAVRKRFMDQAPGFRDMVEPKSRGTVEHVYTLGLKGKAPEYVFCQADASIGGRFAVKLTDIPEQAYVLASAHSRNEQFAVTFWLVPEDGAWKVRSFSIDPSTLGHQDAKQLFEKARAQESSGHRFNAWLLYSAARQLAFRGPFLTTESGHAISEGISGKQPPPEFAAPPPWQWKDDPTAYKVLGLQYIGIGGRITLAIDHEVPAGTGNEDMDRANKGLIAYFKRRYPEYSDVFGALLARAHVQGTGGGFATVDEVPAKNP